MKSECNNMHGERIKKGLGYRLDGPGFESW